MDYLLTDAQWARIAPLLPGRAGTSSGRGQNNHHFVDAVLWLARNGCRWRALSADWGNWHTTYTRFQRWARGRVGQGLGRSAAGRCPAHAAAGLDHRAGPPARERGAQKNGPQALGRS